MLRDRLGGRWLTTSYETGDVLVFSVFTVHASLENRSDRIRLSADTRYQPANQPAVRRSISADPPGHGPGRKRDLIY
jgi:ectoine hydroxylase-related dioxygenase (phytanoyl-CoA dioxygenase family)